MKLAIAVRRVVKATGKLRDLRLVGVYSYRLNYVDVETGLKYSEPQLENAKFIRLRVDRENRLRDPLRFEDVPPALRGLRYCGWDDVFTFEPRCPRCLCPTTKVSFYREEIE